MLTPALCEHAELSKGTAMIVGCGNLAEIWNEAHYNEKIDSEAPEEYDDLFDKYGV